VRPLTDAGLVHLLKRMRQYRLFFAVYALSSPFYAASALALSSKAARSALTDAALLFGLVASSAFFTAYWALLGPSSFKARAPENLDRAADHIFFSMLFLLALGEGLGMAALAAASFGAGPAWKLLLLCFWQMLLSALITPDRNQWDRLLTRWEKCNP